MDVGDDDGEVGEQQEGQRLRCDMQVHQDRLNAPLRPRNGIQAMVRMMPEVQNGMAQSKNSTVRVVALRTWKIRNQAMLKPRNSVIAQTMTCEFQRAEIDAEGRRRGQKLAVIVEHEGRVDADAIVVEEADHEEQDGGKREQRQQYQREWANLQPGDQPGRKTAAPPACTGPDPATCGDG